MLQYIPFVTYIVIKSRILPWVSQLTWGTIDTWAQTKFSFFTRNWNCLNASTNGMPSMSPIVPPNSIMHTWNGSMFFLNFWYIAPTDSKHKASQLVSTYLWLGSIFSNRLVSNPLYPFLNCICDMRNNCNISTQLSDANICKTARHKTSLYVWLLGINYKARSFPYEIALNDTCVSHSTKIENSWFQLKKNRYCSLSHLLLNVEIPSLFTALTTKLTFTTWNRKQCPITSISPWPTENTCAASPQYF